MSRAARYASRVLLALGVFALGYVAYVVIDEQIYQARELKRFEQQRAGADAAALAPPAPVPPLPVEGAPIGEIQIARLGVSVMVVQGESEPILQRAVGHLARTALPGSEGNVVLAGHRDTFFRKLSDINPDDEIVLTTPDGTFHYFVERTNIVEPQDVWVLNPTNDPTLTLVTCYPFVYVGSAPHRFIVRAAMRSPAAAPAATQPITPRRSRT